MIKGMDIDTARRYVNTRQSLDDLAERIYAQAYTLSLLFDLPQEQININSHAIGYLGKMIADDVLRIIEHLDDHFASMAKVEIELEALENDK